MRLGIYCALTLLAFPFAVSAAVGFPAQSVWLSDTKPALGEKIRIYAVVYNGTESEASGTLTFLVDGKENGSKDITLDSGESTVVASPWTATEGEHTFSARFSGGGESAEVQMSETVAATVEAPPSQAAQAVEQARSVTTQIASASIPIVSTVANTVFNATEAIREAGLAYLESRAAGTEEISETSDPSVLGTTTANQVGGFEKGEAEGGGVRAMLATAAHAASVGALAIFRSLWLFYPVFVGLLLLIARWLYRWVTRPRF